MSVAERRPRVLRVFAVTSAQGAYGGPSETAQRQATLARSAGFEVALVAGSFDSGTAGGADVRVARVRHVLGLNSFIDVFSLAMAALLVRCVRQADLVHISFSREPVPMFAAMLCRLLRVPAVIQPHGMLTSRTSADRCSLHPAGGRPFLGVDCTHDEGV